MFDINGDTGPRAVVPATWRDAQRASLDRCSIPRRCVHTLYSGPLNPTTGNKQATSANKGRLRVSTTAPIELMISLTVSVP